MHWRSWSGRERKLLAIGAAAWLLAAAAVLVVVNRPQPTAAPGLPGLPPLTGLAQRVARAHGKFPVALPRGWEIVTMSGRYPPQLATGTAIEHDTFWSLVGPRMTHGWHLILIVTTGPRGAIVPEQDVTVEGDDGTQMAFRHAALFAPPGVAVDLMRWTGPVRDAHFMWGVR
jgi:hypothetical protein